MSCASSADPRSKNLQSSCQTKFSSVPSLRYYDSAFSTGWTKLESSEIGKQSLAVADLPPRSGRTTTITSSADHTRML